VSNFTCFLVDDDQDDQTIFQMALTQTKRDAKCIFANDGADALVKITTGALPKPDAIFIDINMPRMNGVQLLEEIKKLEEWKNVPAFMYSTSAEPKIVHQCMNLGATDFLQKQLTMVELRETLAGVLKRLNKL